jgi:hypothetical protein
MVVYWFMVFLTRLLSASECTASNVNDFWIMIWKLSGRKQSWPHLGFTPGLWLEDLDSDGKYRVIKKSLCTWWLQYRKVQVLFKISPASLQTFIDTHFTPTPSVIPNSDYVIMVSDWNCLKYFCVFLYCNHYVHTIILVTPYNSRQSVSNPEFEPGISVTHFLGTV